MDKIYDLTIREASERLEVSETTIRRMIKRGQLTRIYGKGERGRILKFSSEEVDQLIKQGERLATLPMQLDNLQLTELAKLIDHGKADAYKEELDELKLKYDELLQRHEVVVYKLGASENRTKELEVEAESLRMQAKKGIWNRIKDWWRWW